MPCCPDRPPLKASRWLPGGLRRSSSRVAAASIRSLRRAAFARSLGKPFGIRSAQTAAVRLSPNDRITARYVSPIGPGVKKDHRGVPESARHQAQCRDDRGEWNPGAHHFGDPVGDRPDIIMAINNWPQLYGASVADVSDVSE